MGCSCPERSWKLNVASQRRDCDGSCPVKRRRLGEDQDYVQTHNSSGTLPVFVGLNVFRPRPSVGLVELGFWEGLVELGFWDWQLETQLWCRRPQKVLL